MVNGPFLCFKNGGNSKQKKNQLHHEYFILSFQNNNFKFCFKVINVNLVMLVMFILTMTYPNVTPI